MIVLNFEMDWVSLRGRCCGFGSTFHKNNGRQWPESEKGTPRVAYRRRMALAMHIISPCVRPRRAHKQEIHIFLTYFEGPRGARGRQENEKPSEPDRLGGGRGRVNRPLCGLVCGLDGWKL